MINFKSLIGVMKNRKTRSFVLCGFALLVVPFFHFLAFLEHKASYTGICGPHAPDIRAHACTYDQYMKEFGAGFEGIALLFAEIRLGGLSLFVAGVIWIVIDVKMRKQNSKSQQQ